MICIGWKSKSSSQTELLSLTAAIRSELESKSQEAISDIEEEYIGPSVGGAAATDAGVGAQRQTTSDHQPSQFQGIG